MSNVINTNAPIDFSDIKDSSDNILDEVPDPAEAREQKRLAKEQEKEMKARMKEIAKEQKKNDKSQREMDGLKEDLGISGSIDAQQARARIMRYRTSKKFGKFLKEAGFKLDDKVLNKLDEESLISLQERVAFAVSNKNSEGLFKSGVMGALQGAEFLGENVLGLHVQGLTATLNQSEAFHELVEELMLENQFMVYTKPQWRLLYMIISTGMAIHNSKDLYSKLSPEQKQMYEQALSSKQVAGSVNPQTEKPAEKPKESTGPKDMLSQISEMKEKFKDLI